MLKRHFLICLVFVALLVSPLFAQSEGSINSGENANVVTPYFPGEYLTYIGKYKRFGFSFTIAELRFEVMKENPEGKIPLATVAVSKGSLSKLFNFKFFLRIDSQVDREKLHVDFTKKRDEQGDRIRDSRADFNYEAKRVIYTETDPNDPNKAPRRVASEIGPGVQDIVSAVYMLRSKDLEVGKTFTFDVSDSGLVYSIPVKITARERIKSELGKRFCWKAEAEVFGPGRIIEQEGSLTIWITDDEDRVPVLAKLDTKLGDVEIKLKDFGSLRSGTEPD